MSATENERLAVRTPPAEKGAFHAFEYLISADDASATTLTFVHSGYLGDDWEGEFDFGEMIGFGWDMYLHTLASTSRILTAAPLTSSPPRDRRPRPPRNPGPCLRRPWAFKGRLDRASTCA